ncbi:dihydropteroate synthase [Granulicella sp. WH15]|uniref:dihydropteroate synthase n=1 Tax=Granulicella sp. WH15 TaxID=2602070 RepID=UPI001366E244|nr:dihydropteroate synthase [Granulicella sp. WH15]QHN02457.1 dihydropteroate synthase [Granulicella sp. WH15]
MAFPLTRPRFDWQLRTRTLALGEETLLMGILNLTPDSFSDGGQFTSPQTALDQALWLLDEGAAILDLGGESTRPDSTPVTAEEEQARILPVLAAILKARPDAVISIDTYHASTARRAAEAGAEIVNDVSGLLWDAEMASTAAETRCGLVLTHTRGTPQEWATQTRLAPSEVIPIVLEGLRSQLATASAAGIPANAIVLDPGFGFGKRGEENFVLHAHLADLQQLGHPLLVGTSRKGFLGKEIHATTASNVAAILAGAHILRVHEIRPAAEAAAVADKILLAATQS